jgi:ABC-2 type transport system permease protein
VRRLLVVAAKELRLLARDRLFLFITLAFPVALLFVFGTLFSTRPTGIRVAVRDLDGSSESRRLVRDLTATPDFVLEPSSSPEAALAAGRALLGIVIPPDFGRRIAGGRGAEVGLFVDGTDLVAARAVEGYLEAFGASVAREPARAGPRADAVAWFNPERRDPIFLIPGVIAIVLFCGPVIFTSLSLVREKSSGTWDALAATPIGDAALLAGKLLPFLVQMSIIAAIVIAVSCAAFHVPFRGAAPVLAAATVAFIMSGIGLGATFSALSPDEDFVWYYISLFVLLPCLTLSGFIYPLSSMPPAARVLARLFPLSHYLDLVRGVLVRGAGARDVAPEAAAIAGFAAAALTLAVLCLRRARGPS